MWTASFTLVKQRDTFWLTNWKAYIQKSSTEEKEKGKKKKSEKTKSQNLPEISLFLQLAFRVLLRSFSAKYLWNQPQNILPLQQLVLRFYDVWIAMNFSADKQLFWSKLNKAMVLANFVDPLGIVHANYSLKCCLLKWTPGLGFQFLI